MSAAFRNETAVLADEFKAVRYSGAQVAGDYFALIGIKTILGRTLTQEDYIPGSLPVVVLSYDIWQNHFGGDKNIIGQKIEINRTTTEVVGVAEQGVEHPAPRTLWQPLHKKAVDLPLKDSPAINFLARVKEGIPLEQSVKELETIFKNSPELAPIPGQVLTPRILPFKISKFSSAVDTLSMLLVASIFVLLLCCINVGNLLLARANGRMKETAIRLALGAPREKLISQMMWEAFYICTAGGVLAILIAGWGLDATMSYFTGRASDGYFPKWAYMGLGFDNVLVAGLIVVLTIFFTGFVPAWRASNCDFNEVLKDASKTSLGKKAGLVSRVLVGLQIMLSCTLMIMAGVQIIIIHQAVEKGYGVDLEHFLSGRVNPQKAFYPKGEAQVSYFNRVLEEVQNIPGVEAAALMSHVPLEWSSHHSVEPEGMGYSGEDFLRVNFVTVYPGAIPTLGIPLLEGRLFDQRDTADTPKVIVVSDMLARTLWPNESAVGKRLRYYSDKKGQPKDWLTVVGVVPQIVQNDIFDSEKTPTLYRPFKQNTRDAMAVLLKTHGDPAMYKKDLENAVLKIDPNTPLYRAYPFTVRARSAQAFDEFVRLVFVIFASCALLMSATGIYGMMANHVKRHTQEIGIKRALGVPEGAIARLMMKQSLLQILAGFVVGLPLGYVVSQLIVDDLGAVNNFYHITYLLVPIIIASVVLIATVVPLANVLRQSPSTSLRYE